MSVDYFLIRIPPNQQPETCNEWLPFGSQQEIIDRLCAVIGFEFPPKQDLSKDYRTATIRYTYQHRNEQGRVIKYLLQKDPVACISINRAYPEDLLPIVEILNNLSPFAILTPQGQMELESLVYSFDDWIEKNYEEEEPLDYVG